MQRKKLTLFILFFVFTFLSFSLNALENNINEYNGKDEKVKSSWYIDFGLGSGDGSFTSDEVTGQTFDESFEGMSSPLKFSMKFGVGTILNPNFHFGFDITVIRAQSTDLIYGQVVTGALQFNNYFGVLSFFPMETGLFLRAGGGLSAVVQEFTVGPTTYTISENGFGALGGIGYAFWLGKTFNLGLNFDYSYQKYNGDLKSTKFYMFYVSLNWF